MRLKYYLRGLGIGIVVTTLILLIVYNLRGKNISDDEVIERAYELGMVMPVTEDDTESSKLVDYVPSSPEDAEAQEDINPVQSETETNSSDANAESSSESENTNEISDENLSEESISDNTIDEDAVNTTVIELTPEDESADNNIPTEVTTPSQDVMDNNEKVDDNVVTGDNESNEADIVEFVISRGQVSMTVAKNLMDAGIIDDADAFNTYIQDIDYDNRIRVGNYSIAKGADFDTIIKIITSK